MDTAYSASCTRLHPPLSISATAANIYGEEIYEYDALDNVRRVAGYPNGLGGYVQDHRYQYDAGQRLSRIDNELGVPQWYFSSSGLGEALTRTGHGQTWSYQWNAAGRMTRADRVHAGSTWEAYAYDAHGHRTLSTRNTGSTRHQVYSRAGQLLYTEDSRDNQRIDYIHLDGKLVAQRSRPLNTSTATLTWHHTDAIQSANVETSSAGVQTYRTVRMPFGAPYSGQYREGPGFAGHVTDTQTNLTYMQQRYYDPIAQRFLSPDPVDVSTANGSNFNRYWYANNNPYRFTDPDGRQSADRAYGAAVGLMLRNDPEKLRVWAGGEAAATTEGSFAEQGAAMELAAGEFVDTGDYSGAAVAGAVAQAAVMLVTKGKATTPYKRPSGATTQQQRASVQGKPCVDCGAVTSKQIADHKTPLVQEHYETGAIDKAQMRSVDAVQPQCPTCSARQGAETSRYSREQKQQLEDH